MLVKLALGNVRKSLSDFGVYFVTVVLGVAVFYAFNSMTAQKGVLAFSETQENVFGLLGYVIGGVSAFIAFVLIFLVVYANRFLIKRRKREFGLYLLLGMSNARVMTILILETLIVGLVSLVIGLALGFLLSQALLYVTSALFQIDVASAGGLAFVFSKDAFVATIVVFVGIFVIAGIFGSLAVAKAKLIDLMHAQAKSEKIHLRNLPLSLVLFVISLVIIGVSYHLLLENGLMEPSPEFAAATVLVCVGTVLFFYSLSGFLLRLIQLIRPLYLRGLNAFTLRQMNAKVNTTFATLSIVCMVLFLALTSVCGGLGIRNALDASLAAGTKYSVSESTTYASYDAKNGYFAYERGPYGEFAKKVNYDALKGLTLSAETIKAGNVESLVQGSAQIDLWVDPENSLTFGDLEKLTGLSLRDAAGASISANASRMPLSLVSLSDINRSLELAGEDPLTLKKGEAVIFCGVDTLEDFFQEVVNQQVELSVGNSQVVVTAVRSDYLMTNSVPTTTGILVVNDELIPNSAQIMQSILNIQCANTEDETKLLDIIEEIHESTNPNTFPVDVATSKTLTIEQSLGLSTIVAYLAIYLGFVLVVACAAILAIQQLSEAGDNAYRYALLRKIGAPEGMIQSSLFTQIAIYFIFPLILAIAHSACALIVVSDVVAVFGALDITGMVIGCAICFLLVYGTYFVLTYAAARRMAK